MVRKAFLGFAIAATLFFAGNMIYNFAPTSAIEVQFINIGQGDASLIKTAGGRTFLIDSGNDDARGNADASIVTYLRNQRVTTVDVATISHYDLDHAGGMRYIGYYFSPRLLILPRVRTDEEQEVHDDIIQNLSYQTKVVYAKEGDRLEIGDNLKAEVLWWNANGKDNNERSIVMQATAFADKYLYTGDIGESTEAGILGRIDSSRLISNVVKVPHHGSKYSSSPEFFNAVHPVYSVISVGKNSYGHPTDEAMDSIIGSGSKLLRTDLDGTIIFRSNEVGLKRQ
ncbi:MAG: MBL fold metallo-hydrolase [Oscillospiraceae bacterium]|nr:MBL fold metallo-hydrolase [Oscillospiraceae bacterium]